MQEIIKKVFNNKLLLAKISFSLFNLITITILSIYFNAELSGKVLYAQGIIFFSSAFSRLGSDYFWVSSNEDTLAVDQKEAFIISIGSLLAASIAYLIVIDEKSISIFYFILLSVLSINLIQYIGRVYQKKEKHVLSLFLLSIASNVFVIPILFLFNDINPYALILTSNIAILIIVVSVFGMPSIKLEINNYTLKKRIHFFPIILYGTINQNIIAILGGTLGKEEQTALLILFQRITGLVLWPQLFHMQRNITKMNSALSNIDNFMIDLKSYIFNNIKQTMIYSMMVTIICFIILIKSNEFNVFTSLSFILVLMASIINTFFGHIQYQIGSSKNGFAISMILIISILFSFFQASINNYNYLALALSFFIFHFIVHISSYIILVNWIKNK